MSVKIFLSSVSDEFGAYRDLLRTDLTRQNVEVKVQEDFKDFGHGILDLLETYIAHCDAVIHLVGDMNGSAPIERDVKALLTKYPDLPSDLPPVGNGDGITYTQWEAWLALYHRRVLLIAQAADTGERGPKYAPTDSSRAAQAEHLNRLKQVDRWSGFTFTNPVDLANHIKWTGILDLLVEAYAEEIARARDVAEGFIHEMAKKVAGDRNLDFEGKQQAVRNAIDIYEKEIAGGQTQTNVDAIVDEALARARSLADAGKSGLARATLRQAAETMRRDEEERREKYVAGVTLLCNRERDIALAAYDGEAAAEAIILLAEASRGANIAGIVKALNSEAAALYEYGRDRGSNVHLVALIALRRKLLDAASSNDERGTAYNDLGVALAVLGGRESGTARLEEAVLAIRAALEERTRDRCPLDWATTQSNLGNVLSRLGERESRSERLEAAVLAYRAALEERTRDRVPFDWATTQTNLGTVLWRLGEWESGTARLEEAASAYRAALEERTRERVPDDWARTQVGLGMALWRLGEKEGGTARLEEAVFVFRAALEEISRDRLPLDWATTQMNLGNVLATLGEREGATARLEEAAAAFRMALKERTRDRAPLDWARTQTNLGFVLTKLAEREIGTARLEEAVAVLRTALEELSRDRAPRDWAMTQANLGAALWRLAEREGETAQLDDAVAAFHSALGELTEEAAPYQHAVAQQNLERVTALLVQRRGG